MVIPLGKVGAPVPALFVKLSARTLPPAPPRGVTSVEARPRTSGTKSSPSSIIKSKPSSTATSAYCVYAALAEAGGLIVTVLPILSIASVSYTHLRAHET